MLTVHEATRAMMPFRQWMMADPATMAYNAPWSPPDGTIPFPEEAWDGWLADWTGSAPERWCAYLANEAGDMVGEISYHHAGQDMGVMIAAPFRGRGYGREALALLVAEAFRHEEISELRNCFEPTRTPALRTHLAAGFVRVEERDGLLTLRLTRERFEERRRAQWLRQVTDAMCAWDAGSPQRIHHFLKVQGFARQIALAEGLTDEARFTLEAAALTHDVGIKPALKQYGACGGAHQERLGPPEASRMLAALGLPEPVVRRVCFLISRHHTTQGVDGPDWQILLEADFLVNMIESGLSPDAIDAYRDTVFRTAEGKRLLAQVRQDA